MSAAGERGSSSAKAQTSATVDVVYELSQLLRCDLDRRAVQIIMALIDAGVNPSTLASTMKTLKSKARDRSAPDAAAGGV